MPACRSGWPTSSSGAGATCSRGPRPRILKQIGLPLAVATNCSNRLGRQAAGRVGVPFAVVETAESVGFYKPRPEVYHAVLARLGTAPARTLFVAGSASDVPGAKAAGMPVYWHNRIGLAPRGDAKPDHLERTLERLPECVTGSGTASREGATT